MFDSIFGPVLLGAVSFVLGILVNSFNLIEKGKKFWKERKKLKHKKNFLIGNPDFTITLYPSAGAVDNKCNLNVDVLNLSKETKFVHTIVYEFESSDYPNLSKGSTQFHNDQKWPKRLEHGEKFTVTVPFHSILIADLHKNFNKNVKVYSICTTSTGDKIRSKSIDFDYLTVYLEPINSEYLQLAKQLSKGHLLVEKSIATSLWQLQLYGKLTSHIGKQLSQVAIPIKTFLADKYEFREVPEYWMYWQNEILRKNIEKDIVIEFLQSQ